MQSRVEEWEDKSQGCTILFLGHPCLNLQDIATGADVLVVHASIRPATPTAVSQTGLGISDHHGRFASEIRYLSAFIETAHVGVVYWSEHEVSEWVNEGVKSCEKDAD